MYEDVILETIVKSLNVNLFRGDDFFLQQDSARAHKTKTTQRCLEKNVSDFIENIDWPSSIPDLNPLDY